jgi:hypothetical protein
MFQGGSLDRWGDLSKVRGVAFVDLMYSSTRAYEAP